MPQGADFSAKADSSTVVGLNAKDGKERKKTSSKTPRGRVFAPKSAAAADTMNAGYLAALPTMTKNIEMIAAGRLLANGSNLKTAELKKLAEEQLSMQTKASQKKVLDPMAKRHVKGMRGDTRAELEELADLAPELKKQLEKLEKDKAAVAAKRHAHLSTPADEDVDKGSAAPANKKKGFSADTLVDLQKSLREELDGTKSSSDDEAKDDDAMEEAAPPAAKRGRKEGHPTKVNTYAADTFTPQTVFPGTQAAPAVAPARVAKPGKSATAGQKRSREADAIPIL